MGRRQGTWVGFVRNVIGVSLGCVFFGAVGRVTYASVALESERGVHRFLSVEISPDGRLTASVEGDSPPTGGYPSVRELVIRQMRNAAEVRIPLPCVREAECWPESPSWSPDGKSLIFALRKPGIYERSVYSVAPDGSGLTKLLDFNGTIQNLRYGPDGQVAMLATANAKKEAGPTEARQAIAGDLDEATPEQRIAVLENGSLRWASPRDLYVYEYDWRPGGRGFVGTAAPGDGDDNWYIAKLYAFGERDGSARILYATTSKQQQIADPKVSRDGSTVAFIAGIMSDFGGTGGEVYSLSIDGGAY